MTIAFHNMDASEMHYSRWEEPNSKGIWFWVHESIYMTKIGLWLLGLGLGKNCLQSNIAVVMWLHALFKAHRIIHEKGWISLYVNYALVNLRHILHIYIYMHVCVLSHFSHVRLFAILWTVAHQAPLFVGCSRQEYWGGLPCPPPGDLPDPGIKPAYPAIRALQVDSSLLSHQGSPYIWIHKHVLWACMHKSISYPCQHLVLLLF